jgi:hypothetical protein
MHRKRIPVAKISAPTPFRDLFDPVLWEEEEEVEVEDDEDDDVLPAPSHNLVVAAPKNDEKVTEAKNPPKFEDVTKLDKGQPKNGQKK